MSRARRTSTKPHVWRVVLGCGVALWMATLLVLRITENATLVPSAIFLGSFVVPVTLTVWLVERQQYSGTGPDGAPSQLTVPLLCAAFVGAGVLGVALSALVEALLPTTRLSLFYLCVAVLEESVKLAAVWLLARGFDAYERRDGMVLGACVGFGFSAFESAGYAFTALIRLPDSGEGQYVSIIGEQLVRALLTPVGHGLWTALLAGALFASARGGRLRITGNVVAWWVAVVLLHWVWDEATQLAAALAYVLTDTELSLTAFEAGPLADPRGPVLVAGTLKAVVLIGCASVGLWLARREWVKGRATVSGFPHGPSL